MVFESSPFLIVGEGDTEVIAHAHRVARRLLLCRGQRLVFGRGPDVDVVIDSPLASRRIFSLEVTAEGAVFIEDVGSTCGTNVNGQRVERIQLRCRDVVSVGGGWILFQQGELLGAPTMFEEYWAEEPISLRPIEPAAPPAGAALPAPQSRRLWQRILSLLS